MVSLRKILKDFDGFIVNDKSVKFFRETQHPNKQNFGLISILDKPSVYVCDAINQQYFEMVQNADVYALCISFKNADKLVAQQFLQLPSMLIAFGDYQSCKSSLLKMKSVNGIAIVDFAGSYQDDAMIAISNMVTNGYNLIIAVNDNHDLEKLCFRYHNINIIDYENL